MQLVLPLLDMILLHISYIYLVAVSLSLLGNKSLKVLKGLLKGEGGEEEVKIIKDEFKYIN